MIEQFGHRVIFHFKNQYGDDVGHGSIDFSADTTLGDIEEWYVAMEASTLAQLRIVDIVPLEAVINAIKGEDHNG